MSTDIPASQPDDIEVVGRSGADADDDLWGDVPRDERLEWLRTASRDWPFYPGAAVGGLTAQALAQGHLVRSPSLIRVARNAFEAGFTPDEYALMRRLAHYRTPDHLVVKRDDRAQHADRFLEIDAHDWVEWLDLVRSGEEADVAMLKFLAAQRRLRDGLAGGSGR